MASVSLSKGIRSVPLRIGNMRKPQGFVTYPYDPGAETIKIQSEDCMASVNLATGECKWVRNKGGSYFHNLSLGIGNIGKGVETLPPEIVALLV